MPGNSRVNFALESDHFVVGYFTNSTLKSGMFSQLISGAGWLVRKYAKVVFVFTLNVSVDCYHVLVFCYSRGVSYINQSMTTESLLPKFVTEKAPRTAIVLSTNGSLSLMQVDIMTSVISKMDDAIIVCTVRVTTFFI